MTVFRREDVQSRIASWDGRPYRMLSSPVLAIVPLIIRRLRGPLPTRLMVSFTALARPSRIRPLLRRYGYRLKRRPEEAGQLARDGDGDLGCGLVLLGEPPEAATQALLRLVRNRNHTTGLSPAPS